MPRPNRARSLESEENLQHRIAWEREQRGMTYEGLAKRMTDLGCAIHASAIYKIEKGSPPRKVTVSELIALSKVFETTTDELLVPLDLRHAQAASQIVRGAQWALSAIHSAADQLEAVSLELKELAAVDPRANEILSVHLGNEDITGFLVDARNRLNESVVLWVEAHLDATFADPDELASRRTQPGGESK